MSARGIAILGSTGSIGCNTFRVLEALGPEKFRIVALAAGRNVAKLVEQIARHEPDLVSVENDDVSGQLKAALLERHSKVPRIATGEQGLVQVATHPEADCLVSATVGAVGFVPTLRALQAGKRVALANKETLVIAGELMTRAARQSGAEILPVDSEHNALHQCLRGETSAEVRRIILTASGGPFRRHDKAAIQSATVAEALQHPTWSMGAKITIDSATLMNKGLEVIEAHWLFGFGADEISIVVHPESIVHSMIEMVDGSVIAQLGVTDMRHAIQYALTYPERHDSDLPSLDLARLSSLHFEEPDLERFPCISLAYRALRTGGTLPAAMNAANEEAVQAFINEQISFADIPQIITSVMDGHRTSDVTDLAAVVDADRSARASAQLAIAQLLHDSRVTGVV